MPIATTPIMGERRTVTTEQLMSLLEDYDIYLPMTDIAESDLSNYSETDQRYLEVEPYDNQIVAVEPDGEEEVQCIMVDHPDHLYLTDDFIPTHNTSNIVFLKSTDDKMIDTLTKMSGTRHRTYRDSKTVTLNMDKVVKSTNVEGSVSYNMTTQEEPVISYNDLAFIAERNSIVFRAGDSPVWNRRETILPMSWRMFGGKGEGSITHPGHEYTLQTIPTLSTAKDFDVRLNQPDFVKMVEHRVEQAAFVDEAEKKYARGFGYTEFEIQSLEPDIYAEDIMTLVDLSIKTLLADQKAAQGIDPDADDDDIYDPPMGGLDITEDLEERERLNQAAIDQQEAGRNRYAEGQISRRDLVDERAVMEDGLYGEPVEVMKPVAQHGYDGEIVSVYLATRSEFSRDGNFIVAPDNSELRHRHTGELLIYREDDSESKAQLIAAMEAGEGVYAQDRSVIEETSSWQVTDEMYFLLASLDDWRDIAQGAFDKRMAMQLRKGS